MPFEYYTHFSYVKSLCQFHIVFMLQRKKVQLFSLYNLIHSSHAHAHTHFLSLNKVTSFSLLWFIFNILRLLLF